MILYEYRHRPTGSFRRQCLNIIKVDRHIVLPKVPFIFPVLRQFNNVDH